MSQLIIHIVPQLPPTICGVGDYATLVGQRIEELTLRTRCAYLACGHRKSTHLNTDVVAVDATGSCDPSRIWRATDHLATRFPVDNITLLLHYSGYGYNAGGAPAWLASALETPPARFANLRLITFYHELYATGWPWERAFWKSGSQRGVATRIARKSNRVITNRAESAHWLTAAAELSHDDVQCLPMPSNVDEPTAMTSWRKRPPVAVMFGGARFKRRFLSHSNCSSVVNICQRLGVRRIVNLGEVVSWKPCGRYAKEIDFIQTGYLPASEISSYFQSARIALVEYFPGYYAKSSVFAAAAAHGVAPILTRNAESEKDDLVSGENYLETRDLIERGASEIAERVDHVSAGIVAWYQGHNIARHARVLAGAVNWAS